jgi:hypothetical protein
MLGTLWHSATHIASWVLSYFVYNPRGLVDVSISFCCVRNNQKCSILNNCHFMQLAILWFILVIAVVWSDSPDRSWTLVCLSDQLVCLAVSSRAPLIFLVIDRLGAWLLINWGHLHSPPKVISSFSRLAQACTHKGKHRESAPCKSSLLYLLVSHWLKQVTWYNRQFLKWFLVILVFFLPWCNLLPLPRDGPRNMLLINKRQCRWCEIPPWIRL